MVLKFCFVNMSFHHWDLWLISDSELCPASREEEKSSKQKPAPVCDVIIPRNQSLCVRAHTPVHRNMCVMQWKCLLIYLLLCESLKSLVAHIHNFQILDFFFFWNNSIAIPLFFSFSLDHCHSLLACSNASPMHFPITFSLPELWTTQWQALRLIACRSWPKLDMWGVFKNVKRNMHHEVKQTMHKFQRFLVTK